MPKYLRYIELDLDPQIKVNNEWSNALWGSPHVFPLFEYELGKIHSNGVAKLVVLLTSKIANFCQEDQRPSGAGYYDGAEAPVANPGSGQITRNEKKHLHGELLIDVLVVPYYIDMEEFLLCEEQEREKKLLDSMLSCVLAYADDYGWDKDQCRSAYERVLARNIQFEQYVGRTIQNKENRFKAQCYFSFGKTILLHLCLRYDKKSEKEERILITQMAGAWYCFAQIFGKLSWKNDKIVVLEWRNKRGSWEIDIIDKTVQFKHYKFSEDDDNAQGLYQLACLYLSGEIFLPDHEKAIQLLKRSAALGYKHAQNRLRKITEEGIQFE